jgi:hypothetical protein
VNKNPNNFNMEGCSSNKIIENTIGIITDKREEIVASAVPAADTALANAKNEATNKNPSSAPKMNVSME